jgi:hypothetical protein
LTTLIVTNTATNPNVAAGPLSYQLVDPPSGAAINNNGVITWTPTLAQSPSTNLIITIASLTDSSSGGSSTVSATNSLTVIVNGPYDGINLSDPTQALADNDGDGLSNLIEYALGSDPRNAADAKTGIMLWTSQQIGTSFATMKFKQRLNAAALGLQYLPEVSGDQLTWAGGATNVLVLGISPLDSQFNWVTVRDVTAITPTQARSMRLRVTSGP